MHVLNQCYYPDQVTIEDNAVDDGDNINIGAEIGAGTKIDMGLSW